MLQNAPSHIRFIATLLLTVVIALLFRLVMNKFFPGKEKNKISKGHYIVAAVLLFWGMVDFYDYIAIGTDLIEYYKGANIIHRLVNDNLAQGIIKILLCILVLLVGWIRSKEKKKLRSITAITWLLIFSIMGTWLISMAALTVVTAQEIYDQLYSSSYRLPENVDLSGGLIDYYNKSSGRYGKQHERPDRFEYDMLTAISRNNETSIHSSGNYDNYYSDRNKLIRDVRYPMETAILFYDTDGNLLHSSEDDVMYFSYYTQEEWDAGIDSTSGLHYGWIDISEGKVNGYPNDPYLRFRTMYAGTHSLHDIKAIRVTGYFEGTKLVPVVMHYITEAQIWPIVESDAQFSTGPNSYSYIVSDVDRTGKLEWQLQFDRSAEYEGNDLVTVYLDRPEMWDYESKSLVYNGTEYESLAALTEKLDFPSWINIHLYSNDFRRMGRFELNELLVFGGWEYADYEGFDYSSGGEPETEYILVTAVLSNPLACAISALRNIYIVTGVLALALLLIVRSNIKKRLVQPISDIAGAMEDGWRNIYRPENTPSMWYEAEKLNAGFTTEQDRRRAKESELTRLNTALEYAKHAEQNRRQMVSNIAHEFKTPLAVIHGYAEGLKEHIAEEKRDKYVDVILAESEHLDEMVLELLDLSRLEAGKVKLSQDTFSLAALTHSVFERLELAVSSKNLTVNFEFSEDSTVTADEARIRQVVENFAANAVKYTPEGGQIHVRISAMSFRTSSRTNTVFAIENDSPPLSEEALAKVWDTFYRTDESRSSGGTGLGLAISKNIVELHGGTCSVCNTQNGVEFQFTL